MKHTSKIYQHSTLPSFSGPHGNVQLSEEVTPEKYIKDCGIYLQIYCSKEELLQCRFLKNNEHFISFHFFHV
jgi:hypothetical protein